MTSLELKHLTPHIYFSLPIKETHRPLLGAVVGQQFLLMVDAGNSPAHATAFLAALDEHNLSAPAYIALTHSHWDHIFGAPQLDGLLVASNNTNERLREMLRLDWRDKSLDQRVEDNLELDFNRACIKAEMNNVERSRVKLRQPDISFSHTLDIDLGELTCQLIAVDGIHSPDASIVYVPDDNLVFLGDCLYPNSHISPAACDPRRFFVLLDTLLALPAELYLDSHRQQPLTHVDLEKEAQQIKIIGQAALTSSGSRTIALNQVKKELGQSLQYGVEERLDVFLAGIKSQGE